MNKAVCISVLSTLLAVGTVSAQPTETAGGGMTVESAVICAGIQDREPAGSDTVFSGNVGRVYCWARIVGAGDTTAVTYVWLRGSEEVARVELPVRSSSWRTWSSKEIRPDWTGPWEVRLLDPAGEILKSLTFRIDPAATTAPISPDTSGTGE